MNRTVHRCCLSILLVVLLAGAAGAEEASVVASHPMIGETAPGFNLSTIEGDSLSLGGLKGKYIVIHFGASW